MWIWHHAGEIFWWTIFTGAALLIWLDQAQPLNVDWHELFFWRFWRLDLHMLTHKRWWPRWAPTVQVVWITAANDGRLIKVFLGRCECCRCRYQGR